MRLIQEIGVWEWGKGENYLRLYLNPQDQRVWGENVGREGEVNMRGRGTLLLDIARGIVALYKEVLRKEQTHLTIVKSKVDLSPIIYLLEVNPDDYDGHSYGYVEVLCLIKCVEYTLCM
jgi:hypothetical protein